MAPLSDTRVLVTGGTSGLGRAMAQAIVWLASEAADGVHDERIVATDFEAWLASRSQP